MLRTSGIGKRKFLHAEHCGYGTRDFALVDARLKMEELKVLVRATPFFHSVSRCAEV